MCSMQKLLFYCFYHIGPPHVLFLEEPLEYFISSVYLHYESLFITAILCALCEKKKQHFLIDTSLTHFLIVNKKKRLTIKGAEEPYLQSRHNPLINPSQIFREDYKIETTK